MLLKIVSERRALFKLDRQHTLLLERQMGSYIYCLIQISNKKDCLLYVHLIILLPEAI